jgi:PAS domain S-box-containing protein
MESSYREMYDEHMAGTSYNAAFQRLGMLDHGQQGEALFLGVFLSNAPYDEKLLLLDRTILLVLLAAALLTIVLSLFLSRNITHPIAELLAAMGRIGEGALETTLPAARGGHELRRLFRGFNDMTAELARNREAVTRALRETVVLKEYNEKIVDSIRAGIAIVNRDLVVEKANNAFIESFGLERARVIGVPLTYLEVDVVDERIVEGIFAVFRGEPGPGSVVKRSRTGRVFEIRLYPFYSSTGRFQESSGCVLMADDISAKTRLEEQIIQAEKLATVSMLSAGMAHEINNPLGSILTNVQNLIDEETDAGRRVSLKWIEQETRRIARIVQGLLRFASSDTAPASGSDVNEVVRETVGLVSHSIAREGRIVLCLRLAPDLPATAIGADELRQVVINLLSNAIQAIPGSGRILIMTHPARRGRIPLAVADTGAGIARQNIPRIFDPFFTTKANGEGTGLGLSVVYGIVAKYAGSIDVRSREGRGTRFCLGLPVREHPVRPGREEPGTKGST